MDIQSVTTAKNEKSLDEKEKLYEDLDFHVIELKSVDMGFSKNPLFNEGKNNGCQRISYCSCDCNFCSRNIM